MHVRYEKRKGPSRITRWDDVPWYHADDQTLWQQLTTLRKTRIKEMDNYEASLLQTRPKDFKKMPQCGKEKKVKVKTDI